MLENPFKVRSIDTVFPVLHLVNQPQRGNAAGPRVSREKLAKSALRLVPGSGEKSGVASGVAARRATRLRVLDVGFLLLALGMAAALWWSVAVN